MKFRVTVTKEIDEQTGLDVYQADVVASFSDGDKAKRCISPRWEDGDEASHQQAMRAIRDVVEFYIAEALFADNGITRPQCDSCGGVGYVYHGGMAEICKNVACIDFSSRRARISFADQDITINCPFELTLRDFAHT